jgi:hypothetical protein
VRDDPTQCLTCGSTLSSLSYVAFADGQTVGSCSMVTNNNAQYLTTINKNTAIGASLSSVSYSSTLSQSTAGTILSSFLYNGDVIDFTSFTSNTITFNIGGLPIHQKLIVRAKMFTKCTTENKTVLMTLSGTTPVTVTKDLSTYMETIVEGEVAHNTGQFAITFKFGTHT